MSTPHVAARKPVVMTLEAGEYWWCRCGLSKNQPWCDGAHAGSEFSPQQVTITEARTAALCQCKHSKNTPFCDGAHRTV